MFKDKVCLISPVSMHTHFGMRHLDYDGRKERTVSLSERFANVNIPYERKHDIADAICMLLYINFKISRHPFDEFRFFPPPIVNAEYQGNTGRQEEVEECT